MAVENTIVKLKDGTSALFRAPILSDGEVGAMLEYLKTITAETPFLLMEPTEAAKMTLEQERAFLSENISNPNLVMIVCEVKGEIAGNCQIAFNNRVKTKHRASVAIGLKSKFWNKGIGTEMFKQMIELARERGISQLELDYIEGNQRAAALYTKMGFAVSGEKPNAIRLPNGTILKEYSMVKIL